MNAWPKKGFPGGIGATNRPAAKTRKRATIVCVPRVMKESKAQAKAAAPAPFPHNPAVVPRVGMPASTALSVRARRRLRERITAKASVWRRLIVLTFLRTGIYMAVSARRVILGMRGIVPGGMSLRLLSLTRLEICWERFSPMSIAGANSR